jgi:adenylate cyclase class 2
MGGHAQERPQRPDEEGPHKNRVETETVVEDGPVLGKIFEASASVRYLSMKSGARNGRMQQGHCVLDETPLGVYAELEGPSEWIDATAQQLGISESEFITLSYGRIFEKLAG